jgi:hypothetical protein
MTLLTSPRWLWLASLLIAAGCVPAPDRASTRVENASDIKITMGPQRKTAAESAAPAASTPAAGEHPADHPAPASEKKESAPAATEKAAAPAAETTDGPAKFVGRVVLKGTAPKLPPLVAQGAPVKDAICSKEAVPNQSVVVGPEGGVANVFVYLKKAPKGEIPAAPPGEATLDQHGCVYTPHAQVMRSSQKLHLLNSDPAAHNVRITGRAASFNQTIPAGDKQGLDYAFTSPEMLPAKVQCDFHGWMSAWILPVDHPWAAVTDASGNFEIANLPEGDLEFIVWQESKGYVDRAFKAKAKAGQVIEQTFEIDASSLAQ